MANRPNMLPSRLAITHTAGDLLNEWSSYRCPTMTGQPWLLSELTQAVEQGPHKSALSPEAVEHFCIEANNKVLKGQVCLVAWEDIWHYPQLN